MGETTPHIKINFRLKVSPSCSQPNLKSPSRSDVGNYLPRKHCRSFFFFFSHFTSKEGLSNVIFSFFSMEVYFQHVVLQRIILLMLWLRGEKILRFVSHYYVIIFCECSFSCWVGWGIGCNSFIPVSV